MLFTGKRIPNQKNVIQFLLVHVYRSNLMIIVGCIVIDSLMRGSVREYRYEGHAELFDTVKSTLEAFLSLFFEIASPENTMSADIARALEYIEGNYAEDISVKKLSELLYLDEDYFIKKFKATLGITPYAYIKNLRMAVAKELRHNGASLKDATAAAGFKYSSSYCRAISKQRK